MDVENAAPSIINLAHLLLHTMRYTLYSFVAKVDYLAMKQKLDIIYEDEQLVVVNKAAPFLSIPDRFQNDKPNIYHQLQKQYGDIFIVHRLDKETSGIICFARTSEAHRQLSQQFEHRQTKKHYHAVVSGTPATDTGTINQPISKHPQIGGKMTIFKKGKAAISHYTVLERFQQYSLLDVQIETGRTHQIRVHLAYIHHPLAVDALYAKKEAFYLSSIKRRAYQQNRHGEERPLMTRISLHAFQLTVQHPDTQESMTFEAPYPKDFRATLQQLRRWAK
ncbi:MAG: RluA family pseudouridine synthase [Bacteroidota bacterium]